MSAQQQEQQLNIEISEDVADGIYSNLAIITHSQAEFVVDFINVMPGMPKNKVRSRIILAPVHAKKLAAALIDNIQKFEDNNGKIKDFEQIEIPMTFSGPTAEA